MSKPQIRFKGFEDEWQLHCFSDIATRHSSMKYDENIPSVEYEDINSKKGTLNKDISRKTIHKTGQHFVSGDILFGKLRPYLGNNLLADFEGIAVGDFWIFKQGLVNTRFLYPFLYSNEFSYISNISSGSKMPRSDWGLVSTWKFAVPMSDSEQSLIGELFNNIDKAIAEAVREVSRLEKMKQASLQKMFPRPGATAPEIRFDGFTGEWHKFYLRDIGYWKKGQPLSKADIMDSAKFPCLHYGQLFAENERIYDVETFTDIIPSVTSNGNELLFPDSDVTPTGLGRCCSIDINGVILGSGINILVLNDNINSHFASLNVTNNKAQIIEQVTGTTVKHIHPKNLSEVYIYIPDSMDEQNVISDYFRNLDSLLSAKRQKLVKLRNIKQACLDKMFVNTSDL